MSENQVVVLFLALGLSGLVLIVSELRRIILTRRGPQTYIEPGTIAANVFVPVAAVEVVSTDGENATAADVVNIAEAAPVLGRSAEAVEAMKEAIASPAKLVSVAVVSPYHPNSPLAGMMPEQVQAAVELAWSGK